MPYNRAHMTGLLEEEGEGTKKGTEKGVQKGAERGRREGEQRERGQGQGWWKRERQR